MTEPVDQLEGAPVAQTPASRLAAYMRGGGVVVPLLTALLAFLIGGLVVLVTGHDPIATYKAIFEGTGLQWVFPWVTGAERETAALNLQQTLILTTPLILVGLAWRLRSAPACSTSAARASTSSGRSRLSGWARRLRGCRASSTSCSRSWRPAWPARRGLGSPAC
jgi:hypothetical protein